ncbi:MAG TPA: SRPBCC family protein [Casimicrobiaceae bacterium]|jgi:hypothetical protein
MRHAEAACEVGATSSIVFEYIDRPERLSAHMARRSWQLAGASMTIETDANGGRTVGPHIRLAGRMLGIPLNVEGTVVRRDPPKLKAWETVGEPHLLVIGGYQMSVSIEPRGDQSHVRIAIDYALPARAPARWLGMLFGPMYARWCVGQMARDLVRQFGAASG